ncbi:hypothetical protein FHW12_001930 [Dokdonella fugitiva]|uniref:KDO2-lipid IV(A) lauroyltransferase n=1 Tax=Dokdonella fugitiva TaxID=328517 RepID=A0A839EZD7_9GAMM|nr:hypothetical protein [Dokdonella fugitiva]MBA8887716.1 hypothetical protein [Dokdonella fugitiva]
MNSARALRRHLHDFWILYLAPWLPSWLPWPIAYRCYRFLARFAHVYPEPTSAAVAVAPDYLAIPDRAAFARDVRTVWLVDAADLQLSLRHRADWLPSHVEVRGEWPQGAFVAVSFHYSTGLWVFRDLRRRGRDAVLVAARFERDDFGPHPVRYRYGSARFAEIERLSGQPNAYRPGIRERLMGALAKGVPVVSVMDMPPRLAPRGQRPVHLLGRPACLPDGSIELAREAGVPIVPYWVEFDLARGQRTLVIGEAMSPQPADAVLARLAGMLDGLIRSVPAAWLFWNEWPGWQRDAEGLHAAAFSNEAAEGRLSDSAPVARNQP